VLPSGRKESLFFIRESRVKAFLETHSFEHDPSSSGENLTTALALAAMRSLGCCVYSGQDVVNCDGKDLPCVKNLDLLVAELLPGGLRAPMANIWRSCDGL